DRAFIWEMGKGRGQALTLGNALRIVQDTSFSAFFPVQKGISIWMGDTKVWRKDQSLISPEQIQALPNQLQPGDMLLERREWYLSNVGLPGFWPHVALYVGTPEERSTFFKGEDAVCGWLASQGVAGCDAELMLQRNYPQAYALSVAAQEHGHRPRVMEAISEGVSFTTLEHSAACDSLAVLRPKLPKIEKLRAIAHAFQYQGRPYDFNFDFLTDAALVCSELIYKCYEPTQDYVGIRLPIVEMMGRKLTPPNEIVRQFDRDFGSPSQQTDLVLFFDGHEAAGNALSAPLESFRQSWQRPKWHILLPESAR
ncbi:MAG: YiiX/YebB-like N1pC/P60 family cysteine hydrolase, partial [Desulfatitalea sp.]